MTDPILCPDCGQAPSEAQSFYLDPETNQILARRCENELHANHDSAVAQLMGLTNERNDLALQLAAMRACFNMIVNGIQQAYLSGFVEGRKGLNEPEAAWLQSMVKKQTEAAVKESERPVQEPSL